MGKPMWAMVAALITVAAMPLAARANGEVRPSPFCKMSVTMQDGKTFAYYRNPEACHAGAQARIAITSGSTYLLDPSLIVAGYCDLHDQIFTRGGQFPAFVCILR